MYSKYLFQNYTMTTAYRPYHKDVPEFFRDCPHEVILHCMDRMRKSKKFEEHCVQMEDSDGKFQVTSLSGKVHKVDFGKETGVPSCTCLDWVHFHTPCKHFFAIFSHFEDWSWHSLPTTYLASPLLCSDQKALMGQFPNTNDDISEIPFEPPTVTPQETTTEVPCKQAQDALPQKLVRNK